MRSLPLSLSLPLTLTLSLTLSAGCIRRGPSWAGLSDDAWSRRSDLAGALRYELPTDAHKLAYVTSFAGHDDHVDGAWRSVDSGGVFHGPVVLVTEAHSLRDVTLPAVDDAVLAGERAAVAELGGRGTTRIERFSAITVSGLPGYEAEAVVHESVYLHVMLRILYGDHTFYMQLVTCAEIPGDVAAARAIAARMFGSIAIADEPPRGRDPLGLASGALVAEAMDAVPRAN